MSSKIRILIATLIAIATGIGTFAPGDHFSLNSEQPETVPGYQTNFFERLPRNVQVMTLSQFEEMQPIDSGKTFVSSISHIKPDINYPNLVNTYHNNFNTGGHLLQIWLQGGVYKIFVSQGVVLLQDSNDPCRPLALQGGLLVDANGNPNIVYTPNEDVMMQNWLDIIQSKDTCYFALKEKFTFVGSNIPSQLLGDIVWARLEQVSPTTMEKYNLYVDRHTDASLKTLGIAKVSDTTGKEVAIVSTNNGEYVVKTLPQQDELDGLPEVTRSLLSLVSSEQWAADTDRLNEYVNPMFRPCTLQEIASFTRKQVGELEVNFINKLLRSIQTPEQVIALAEGINAIRDMLEFPAAPTCPEVDA